MITLDILQNAHFNGWVARLRAALSPQFANLYPDINVRGKLDDLEKVAVRGHNESQIIERLTGLLMAMLTADMDLFAYSEQEYVWLLGELTGDHRSLPMSLLLALSHVTVQGITPVEAAAISDWGEATWRAYCGQGKVLGAVKKGKQWLIPESFVRLRAWGRQRSHQCQQCGGWNVGGARGDF